MSVLVSLVISTCVILSISLAEIFFRVDLGDVSSPWMFVNTYIYIIGVITAGYVLTERLMERHSYLASNSKSIQHRAQSRNVTGAESKPHLYTRVLDEDRDCDSNSAVLLFGI